MATLEEEGLELPKGFKMGLRGVVVHDPPTASEQMWMTLVPFMEKLRSEYSNTLYQTHLRLEPSNRLQNGGVQLMVMVDFEPRQNPGQLYDLCFTEDCFDEPQKVFRELDEDEEYVQKMQVTQDSYVDLVEVKTGELFKVAMGGPQEVWKVMGRQSGVLGNGGWIQGGPFTIACTRFGKPRAFANTVKVLPIPFTTEEELDDDKVFYFWSPEAGSGTLHWAEVP